MDLKRKIANLIANSICESFDFNQVDDNEQTFDIINDGLKSALSVYGINFQNITNITPFTVKGHTWYALDTKNFSDFIETSYTLTYFGEHKALPIVHPSLYSKCPTYVANNTQSNIIVLNAVFNAYENTFMTPSKSYVYTNCGYRRILTYQGKISDDCNVICVPYTNATNIETGDSVLMLLVSADIIDN